MSDTNTTTESYDPGAKAEHICITWFISIALAVVLAWLYYSVSGEHNLITPSGFKDAIQLLFTFLFFGLPSLIISCLFFFLIDRKVPSLTIKFILWCVIVFVSININIMIITGAFNPGEMLSLLWQLYAGAAVALLTRAGKFFRLYTKKPSNH